VQDRIPHWQATITDPTTGRWVSTHVINQDTIAWIGQGTLSDREHEHLGRSDIGVIKFRNRLDEDLNKVAAGEDPSGVFRDPAANVLVPWPDNRRVKVEPGRPKEEWLRQRAAFSSPLRGKDDYFTFYAGQPDDVRRAFEVAMGI
jgi:5,5'-dehydrodivanillate O-demethylase